MSWESAAGKGFNHLGERSHPVKLPLLAPRLPLVLLAAVCACWLMGKTSESPLATVRGALESSANIDTMTMALDGLFLATGDSSGKAEVWSLQTGRRQASIVGHHGHVRCVALAPDGASLAAGDTEATVSVWDVASGEMQWSVPVGSGLVRTVAFSRDGMTLAAAASDRCIYVWDTATHQRNARLAGHTKTVTVVAFAPDSRTLVSGSQDGTIRCWDVDTGRARWIIPARSELMAPTVLCVRFSPDGRTVATAINHDAAVRLWDSATGLELPSLRGQSDSIVSVDFSPDGAFLAAGDSRGSLTLWDPGSCRARSSWHAHNGWISSVAFSADGRTLASAGEGAVKLWEISGGGAGPSAE
jgi:WD40 repeat protein